MGKESVDRVSGRLQIPHEKENENKWREREEIWRCERVGKCESAYQVCMWSQLEEKSERVLVFVPGQEPTR